MKILLTVNANMSEAQIQDWVENLIINEDGLNFESSEIVTRPKGLELAKELENYVNGNRNHAEFIDHIVNGTHRTLNQLIIGLFIKVMQAEAKTTRFDGRNEASVELCKRLNLDNVYLPYI